MSLPVRVSLAGALSFPAARRPWVVLVTSREGATQHGQSLGRFCGHGWVRMRHGASSGQLRLLFALGCGLDPCLKLGLPNRLCSTLLRDGRRTESASHSNAKPSHGHTDCGLGTVAAHQHVVGGARRIELTDHHVTSTVRPLLTDLWTNAEAFGHDEPRCSINRLDRDVLRGEVVDHGIPSLTERCGYLGRT